MDEAFFPNIGEVVTIFKIDFLGTNCRDNVKESVGSESSFNGVGQLEKIFSLEFLIVERHSSISDRSSLEGFESIESIYSSSGD